MLRPIDPRSNACEESLLSSALGSLSELNEGGHQAVLLRFHGVLFGSLTESPCRADVRETLFVVSNMHSRIS